MIGKSKWYLVFTILFSSYIDVYGYQLLLNNNSPVTTGSTVILNATLVYGNGSCAKGRLIFMYEDDAFPIHKLEIKHKNCEAIFNISFDTTIGPSNYRYKVDVLQELIPFIYHPITSGRGELIVTENLNGVLQLFQNNTNLSKNSPQTIYVSTNLETVHQIEINTADLEYLNKSANSTSVYWFVDCIYQENTTSYTFSSNYTEPGIQHEILGIVVANIPSSIPAPYVTLPHRINSTFATECQKTKPIDVFLSALQLENQQKYGYFNRSLLTKDPIANVNIKGKVWLQEGEMLNLLVSCSGSGPFRYCAHYIKGTYYNVTGNESCVWDRDLVQCQMQIVHCFREPTNYTLILIVANDVSKIVTPIGISIYKDKKTQVDSDDRIINYIQSKSNERPAIEDNPKNFFC